MFNLFIDCNIGTMDLYSLLISFISIDLTVY